MTLLDLAECIQASILVWVVASENFLESSETGDGHSRFGGNLPLHMEVWEISAPRHVQRLVCSLLPLKGLSQVATYDWNIGQLQCCKLLHVTKSDTA